MAIKKEGGSLFFYLFRWQPKQLSQLTYGICDRVCAVVSELFAAAVAEGDGDAGEMVVMRAIYVIAGITDHDGLLRKTRCVIALFAKKGECLGNDARLLAHGRILV